MAVVSSHSNSRYRALLRARRIEVDAVAAGARQQRGNDGHVGAVVTAKGHRAEVGRLPVEPPGAKDEGERVGVEGLLGLRLGVGVGVG